jgi:secreted PhoX family phosphatase
VANRPDVQRIKKEKRDKTVEPAPAGLTRRRFLTYLGAGSAALTAASTGVLAGCAEGQQGEGAADGSAGGAAQGNAGSGEPFFRPIEASDADELVLPEGYRYDIVRKWGDEVAPGAPYGYNNDYVAYFPIDALDGGENSEDGLLWVNHEYPDPKWVSEYADPDNETRKTPEQIAAEKASVGGSVFRVRKEGDRWAFVEDNRYNRRVDATTPMDVTGPATSAEEIRGATEMVGTLANCGGGVTPWNTVLTCEENFQDYYGERSRRAQGDDSGDGSQGDAAAAQLEQADLSSSYRWFDDPGSAQPPEHYGWVVEVDPFDSDARPRKHTWLGRIRHENAAVRLSESGKVVVYTGHDEEDQCIYKFVSSGTFNPDDREANLDLFADGMLYVADFANGAWNALDFEGNPIFRDNGFASQADVLVRAPEAAALAEEEDGDPIGTPMDRCEDIEVAEDGTVYCALTNNTDHGNFYGQIVKITEVGQNPESEEFAFEVFAAGGPQSGFASPDNLAFDNDGNLWVVTDISSSSLNDGIYRSFKNNGAFVMPGGASGRGGDAYQFASGPTEAELTGPFFTPDGKTLFLAIQHPGEETENVDEPTSRWPDGDIPRPTVVAITGFA